MTHHEARALINGFCIPVNRDFHTLNCQQVQNVIDAADSRNYRAPKNANGSRARYFYALLMRSLTKDPIHNRTR